MAVDKLFIRHNTDPILHKKCNPVETINEELFDLAGKMIACMVQNNGMGLAANQIGLSIRFCVVSLDNGTRQLALVNPVITKKSKEKILVGEGCLSYPTVYLPIKRSKVIEVSFQDLSGEEQVYEMTDLDARIIQHEIDHLNGITIQDYL